MYFNSCLFRQQALNNSHFANLKEQYCMRLDAKF